MLRSPMKLLTLIRHAKSSWKDGDLSDFERPLNARGKRDAPVMGKRLAAVAPPPDLMLASPAARARHTAELIAAEAGLEAVLRFEKGLYLASPGQMLSLAQDQDDSIEHLALVAHNPGTTDLANILADANIQNVPTCGIVRIELQIGCWRDAAPGRAHVVAFDYPKRSA
jgi:phosphohistidine phosphatase